MKIQDIKLVIASILLVFSMSLGAQETITVPLSNPSKPGVLKMNILNGSIKIVGTSKKEIVVTGTRRESSRRKYKNPKGKEGMKRITSNLLQFSATESDNEVRVRSSSSGTTDFEIEVPQNFSLKLSTTNRGEIYVENVNGSMDVSNTNGPITLKDISGSVSADALNKDIKVSFVKVTADEPMAFSSLNGDIDITFPENFKANVKMKTERGEIYTDFDIQTKPRKANVTKDSDAKGNAYRVKLEEWITGSINGGGAEILFKNYNGDVIIRSR